MIPETAKTLVVAVAGLTMAASAHAGNLVTNGSFETLTNGSGQMNWNTDATGWSTNGYNFILAPGTADSTGSTGQFGNLSLWGPGNGSANGLPATSPDGGNYVAADGAFNVGPISQTVNGLTPDDLYAVSFQAAGAQQAGFDGATTEQWQVNLGDASQSTQVLNNPSHGFTGWQSNTLTFAATATSELLSFLSIGTPAGVPPFSLLDGVTMQDVSPQPVPEPASGALMTVGLVGLAVTMRRRLNHRAANSHATAP